MIQISWIINYPFFLNFLLYLMDDPSICLHRRAYTGTRFTIFIGPSVILFLTLMLKQPNEEEINQKNQKLSVFTYTWRLYLM